MQRYKKVVFIIIVLSIFIGVCFLYFLFDRKPKRPPSLPKIITEEPKKVIEELPSQVPLKKPFRKEEPGPELVLDLDSSDDILKKLAKKLSLHPKWVIWLNNKNLIQRFTATIDNIAHGLSPSPHLSFLAPKEKFQVIKKNGLPYINPASYKRYNPIADVFASLDVEGCLMLYQRLKPLFQEAYKDLGYPKQDFDLALFKAIIELLKTPIVEGEILLKKKVITYQMVNSKLEQLSPAQKHLIRMGPKNTIKIQTKLREIALALGILESQLPKPSIYHLGNHQ